MDGVAEFERSAASPELTNYHGEGFLGNHEPTVKA
jgi:hypothetical protein